MATWLFRRELRAVAVPDAVAGDAPPRGLVLAHGIFLAVIVMAGHEPGLFLPVLLLFLVMVRWTGRHQSPVIWRESAFVSLFLAGLVVLGGMLLRGAHSLGGHLTEAALGDLRADAVFMGASAVDLGHGFMTEQIAEIPVDRALRIVTASASAMAWVARARSAGADEATSIRERMRELETTLLPFSLRHDYARLFTAEGPGIERRRREVRTDEERVRRALGALGRLDEVLSVDAAKVARFQIGRAHV